MGFADPRVLVLLAAPVLGAGCRWGPPLCIKQAYSRPDPDTISVGTTVELAPGQLDILGECDRWPPVQVEWSSSAPAIARVSDDGVLVAVSPGKVDAVARSGPATARWSLVVVGP